MVMFMGIRQVITSDISNKLDAETVGFGLGDAWYEIDLTAEERAEFEQVLSQYVQHGRRAGVRRPARRSNYPRLTAEEREEIRVWGEEQGLDPAPYGALAKSLLKAYFDAHGLDLEERIEKDNAIADDDA